MQNIFGLLISHPYYYLNLLLGLTYIPLRIFFLPSSFLKLDIGIGLDRETFIIFVLLIYFASRYKNYVSIEHFIAKFIFYLNICVTILIIATQQYKFVALFMLFWAVLWLTIDYPPYKGPHKFLDLNDDEFVNLFSESNVIKQMKVAKPVYFFVVFYADFADTCFFVS